jgi:hypothetical protein
MWRWTSLGVVLVFFAVAIPAPVLAENEAPALVVAQVNKTYAKVTVSFRASGGDVEVQVWGVDGLEITSDASPVSDRNVRAGETLQFIVHYEPISKPASLAVGVTGTFGEQLLTKTEAFAVGGVPSTTVRRDPPSNTRRENVPAHDDKPGSSPDHPIEAPSSNSADEPGTR